MCGAAPPPCCARSHRRWFAGDGSAITPDVIPAQAGTHLSASASGELGPCVLWFWLVCVGRQTVGSVVAVTVSRLGSPPDCFFT